MNYENVPMMIFILASGYLLIVYLLLALAKRSTGSLSRTERVPGQHQKQAKLDKKVAELG
ncbi:hypothetical protein FHK94_09795 [Cylindrospermopsis raciborskii CS-506_D]|jgi:hypothetical protein|uniref:Uncharacterized protein n=2 Tax=Aphanizomenonaceae TaxID=1892259 RepID=A0A838WJW8_9CYAN|nr:hypothetical protein [Cylindrospermopsis raciborskii CS-506_C]MBA4449936.1 hypothetical protein [Cylindrospermopsis raciborskii CS-506_D]MBA4456546.1 hypothetical protein [Cylindrospermopsis raciborskii CS-506_B]MBA4465906.1 hypothetical protein [Cylindrospermopsis raciborskii CS-506_A]MBU6345139.1 hypothetical protein [Cyanobacteria bacterium REEB494]UJL33816.1 hypothetical protein C6N34_000665 [Cylindrospermopsis raciborskii Cr2010]